MAKIEITFIQTYDNYDAPGILRKEGRFDSYSALSRLLNEAISSQMQRNKTLNLRLNNSGPARERDIVNLGTGLTVAKFRWKDIKD